MACAVHNNKQIRKSKETECTHVDLMTLNPVHQHYMAFKIMVKDHLTGCGLLGYYSQL